MKHAILLIFRLISVEHTISSTLILHTATTTKHFPSLFSDIKPFFFQPAHYFARMVDGRGAKATTPKKMNCPQRFVCSSGGKLQPKNN